VYAGNKGPHIDIFRGVDLDQETTEIEGGDRFRELGETIQDRRVDHVPVDGMTASCAPSAHAILSELSVASAKDFHGAREFLDHPVPPFAAPPTFEYCRRLCLRQREYHLCCGITELIRPRFVPEPERVAKSLLDRVEAEQREAEALGQRGRNN
jgi:hypothetical protein